MWHIRGKDAQGESHEIAFTAVDRLTRQGIPQAIGEITGAQIPDLLRRELDDPDPLPGIDGIESWGSKAAERVGRGVVSYGSFTSENKELPAIGFQGPHETPALAFHSPEVLVANVDGMRELEIFADHSIVPSRVPLKPDSNASILEARF